MPLRVEDGDYEVRFGLNMQNQQLQYAGVGLPVSLNYSGSLQLAGVVLDVNMVPEPSTVALAAGAVIVVLGRRRSTDANRVDYITLRIAKEPEVSQGRVLVRPDGRISIPLVQDLQAAGLTAVQLKAKLEERLKEKIDVPEVTVIVDSIQSYQIYVMGSVGHGGAFSSPIPLTIMQVLANAGGFSEFADKENVRIFRGNLIMRFNYKEYVEGKNLSQNIKLESGDVVEVH